MKILYYDCFSGISGDMNLGAMIDLGVEEQFLRDELGKLSLPGWKMSVEKDQRHGIFGTKVSIIQTREEHVHRHLSDIREILNSSKLEKAVLDLSIKIFTTIAEAEAKIHNSTIESIHFHEVGAIDSIIDVVGAAICFIRLNVDRVIVGDIELGGGFVQCAHGNLPVPAPATAEIIKGLLVKTGGVDFEATTPTGAAILKTIASGSGPVSEYAILKTGYGIGQKINPDKPNILRTYLAEENYSKKSDAGSVLLECNIDDMNPEWYEQVMSVLMKEGASDVFLSNIIMKQGRPGIKLSVLVKRELVDLAKSLIFKHTTTLGLREIAIAKHTLEREFRQVDTPYGKVTVKLAYYEGELVSKKPEYQECLLISTRENIPLKELTEKVLESLKL